MNTEQPRGEFNQHDCGGLYSVLTADQQWEDEKNKPD